MKERKNEPKGLRFLGLGLLSVILCSSVLALIVLRFRSANSTTPTFMSCTPSPGICCDFLKGFTIESARFSCDVAIKSEQAFSITSACPNANLIGTCEIVQNGTTVAFRYFPPFTSKMAISNCTNLNGIYSGSKEK